MAEIFAVNQTGRKTLKQEDEIIFNVSEKGEEAGEYSLGFKRKSVFVL